ncbi:MAG TPA: hypothetical protein VLK24_01270 [Gaiellaceae bacterium]|nr:hypothetical protein [Gaiellaceae bacterium]
MSLDVVVPALRTATVDRLLWSLAHNTVRPDAVSLVSNEVPDAIETHGLEVRLVRFRSERYPIGDRDLALRRDVGIWSSECSHVLVLDDDLVAPANLVESSLALLERESHFWGHHRYISFAGYSPERLLELPPQLGRPRETPPNSWHLWLSCYGGAFGAERSLVHELGGFDLAFSCRQSGEDQSFGKRLSGGRKVFIHEPPFAWHPTDPEPWGPPAYSNLCAGEHELASADLNGMPVSSCRRCPYFVALDEELLFSGEVFLPYDRAEVEVTVRRA